VLCDLFDSLVYGQTRKPILEELGLTSPRHITTVALGEEEDQTAAWAGSCFSNPTP
jgi:hypothetical protein